MSSNDVGTMTLNSLNLGGKRPYYHMGGTYGTQSKLNIIENE